MTKFLKLCNNKHFSSKTNLVILADTLFIEHLKSKINISMLLTK